MHQPHDTDFGPSRTGISGYFRGLPRSRAPRCSQTGEAAPDHCQVGRESTVKEALLLGLSVMNRILAADLEERDRLAMILEVLQRQFQLLRGTIMLLTPEGDSLRVEAVLSDTENPKTKVGEYRRGEGITGQVLETGYPAVIHNIAQEPDFTDRIHRRRERGSLEGVAFLCVPIRLEREIIGTLAVDRPQSAAISLEDAESLLQVVAGTIAHHVQQARRAGERATHLTEENLRLRAALGERFQPHNLVGSSSAMRGVYARLAQVSPTPMTVLIHGESGTGKELIASAIHYASGRKDQPFVRVNCAALNENLLESELFGHEKGAFTGATHKRVGRIEEAAGGTLFLDEIGEFTPSMQVKLLRVLQEQEYQRVGSSETIKADIRLITATNRDLAQEVKAGRFRLDLFYRVNVFPITLPSLKERREDILPLANHFLYKHGPRVGKQVHRISTPAIDALMAYHWPGNVRELEHAIEYALVLCQDGVVHSRDLPPTLALPDGTREGAVLGSLTDQVERLERDLISDALKRSGGNVAAAARELGITVRILRYKASKLRSISVDPLDQD